MKSYIYILFAVVLVSCTARKLFTEYKLYRRDKTINYPPGKLTLKFNSDTTGEFINADGIREAFSQKFHFARVDDSYLIVQEVSPTSRNFISLKQGDTIIMDKKRLHFFYNGDKKYFLSFKKK
jgi:hypothetical protein